MRSPGKTGVIALANAAGPPEGRRAVDLLHEGRERERVACLPEAIACYEAAVAAAERGGERTVLAEALRRLAVVRHHRSEGASATALCQKSYEVARQPRRAAKRAMRKGLWRGAPGSRRKHCTAWTEDPARPARVGRCAGQR